MTVKGCRNPAVYQRPHSRFRKVFPVLTASRRKNVRPSCDGRDTAAIVGRGQVSQHKLRPDSFAGGKLFMLDVHPPHHPAHSWRDFFIHIATIVVGLLIAVGLEQAVEGIHHHRERVELEERLRQEAEQNSKALDSSRRTWQDHAAWLAGVISQLQSAPAAGGFVTVMLPSAVDRGSQPSKRVVWSVAKSNGTLALLPESEQEIFERVDWIAEHEELAFQRSLQATRAGEAIETIAGVTIEPGKTIHFAAAQRDNLIRELAETKVGLADEADVLAHSEAYDMAVGENPGSVEELRRLAYKNLVAFSAH